MCNLSEKVFRKNTLIVRVVRYFLNGLKIKPGTVSKHVNNIRKQGGRFWYDSIFFESKGVFNVFYIFCSYNDTITKTPQRTLPQSPNSRFVDMFFRCCLKGLFGLKSICSGIV